MPVLALDGRGDMKRTWVLCSFAMADLRLSIKIVCLPRRPKFCSGTQVQYLTTPIPGYPTSSFGIHVYLHTGDSCKQTHKKTQEQESKTIFCCRELHINTTRMNSLKVTRKQRKKAIVTEVCRYPQATAPGALQVWRLRQWGTPSYIHVARTTVRSRTLCSVAAWTLSGGTWFCSPT